MKKFISLLFCLLLLLSALSFSVSAEEEEPYPYDMDYYSRFQDDGLTLYVYNWGEYIAEGSDDTMDVVAEFEELTGIRVDYTTFDTNEGLYSKLQSGSAYYDVIIPSDYMISRMIGKGMLEKLDIQNIPNLTRYVDESMRVGAEYDPAGEYSVPYMWGVVGIIYNTKYVTKEVDSWNILWDEDYAGKILNFGNSRDAFATALEKLGYSVNTENTAELEEAVEELLRQKPLIQAYVMDQVYDKMENENAWIAPYYAGDYLSMHDVNEDLAFAFPKEGSNFYVDAMCIPAGCKNKAAAEMFINFMCEPRISAENCYATGYSTPISATKELLDPELGENEYAYPSEEVLKKTEKFRNLSDETNETLDSLWIAVQAGGLSLANYIVSGVALALAAFFIIRRAYIKKKRARARAL